MAQNVNLAVGSTNATGTDIVLAAGASINVGIYRDAGELTERVRATVYMDTPGADIQLKVLDENDPVTVISGPGTFRVTRHSNSFNENYGIFTET